MDNIKGKKMKGYGGPNDNKPPTWMKLVVILTLSLLVIIMIASFARALNNYNDIKNVTFISNYDGDTITVNIHGYPKIIGHMMPIRVKGIDTPEIRGKCLEEKVFAVWAKDFVYQELSTAKKVTIVNVSRGKYFRIVGDVMYDGKSLAEEVIKEGLAIPYDGGTKTNPWCE